MSLICRRITPAIIFCNAGSSACTAARRGHTCAPRVAEPHGRNVARVDVGIGIAVRILAVVHRGVERVGGSSWRTSTAGVRWSEDRTRGRSPLSPLPT